MAEVPAISQDEFDEKVRNAENPVLVDLWAEWCGPCKMVAPIVAAIAEKYAGQLDVYKMDVDENMQLAGELGIRSIPTLLIFKDGHEAQRIIGYRPEAEIAAAVEDVIGD
ncbi:MAG: thioredoxin [Armatimonadota bacterium]